MNKLNRAPFLQFDATMPWNTRLKFFWRWYFKFSYTIGSTIKLFFLICENLMIL